MRSIVLSCDTMVVGIFNLFLIYSMKQLESELPKLSESRLQTMCVDWFEAQYPNELITSFPNGGKRPSKKNRYGKSYSPEGAKLKREGLKAGMPDLFVACAQKGYNGLFIEMKVPGKTTSPAQKKRIAQLISKGYKCAVAYSLDEFRNIITDYLKIQ